MKLGSSSVGNSRSVGVNAARHVDLLALSARELLVEHQQQAMALAFGLQLFGQPVADLVED
jgi:hypothetical protein